MFITMVNIKYYIITLLLFFTVTFQGAANGDPVITYSALTLSVNPQAVKIPEIKLVSENLEIKAFAKFTKVSVTYRLENRSEKNFDRIDYGFPVDWYGSGPVSISSRDYFTESEQEYGWKDSYVKDVHFQIDGMDIPWVCSKDTVLVSGLKYFEDSIKFDYGEDAETDEIGQYIQTAMMYYSKDQEEVARHDLCRKWYYTSFNFAPNQSRTLTIEYTLATNYSVSLSEKGNIFQNNNSYLFSCSSHFSYDFTPSSYWGDGIVGDIDVAFDLSEMVSLEPDYFQCNERIDHPSFVSDFKMTKTGSGRWTSSMKDYDLAKASPMHVTYWGISKEHEDIADLTKRRIPSDEFSVTVNGKNVNAICDGNVYTSARIPRNEDGEYHINVDLNSRRKLVGLLIYPGDNSQPQYTDTISGPSMIKVYTRDHIDILKYKDKMLSACGRVYESHTIQGLTDAAEKIIVHYPSVSHYAGDLHYNWEKNHLDIVLMPTGDKDPYISEVMLLGELPEETLFMEEEVDIKPSFGTGRDSLTDYIELHYPLLDKIREDNGSYEIHIMVDHKGNVTYRHDSYNGERKWKRYEDRDVFEMELRDAAIQLLKSMPSWSPATISGENVGCRTHIEIR